MFELQRETDIQEAVGHTNLEFRGRGQENRWANKWVTTSSLGGEVGKEAQYLIFASFFGVNTSPWLISSYQPEVTVIEYRVGKKWDLVGPGELPQAHRWEQT